jgi:hypothetical protein
MGSAADTGKNDEIRAKKAERRALGWLTRQGGWEIRLDQLHSVNFGASPATRRRSTDSSAA